MGVEALPSWRHPALGVVRAAELLPLAEDLGLLGAIHHWALHASGRLLAGWRRQHEQLWLALAVRPRTLGQAARIDGITPAALTLVLAHVKAQAAQRHAG